MRPSRTHSSGFSLVEVLIATIVLSLGLLGLSALFAGAAVQQQRSSQVTDSVLFISNIEALLKSRLVSADVISSLDPTVNPNVFKWDVLYSEYVNPSYMIKGETQHSGLQVEFASNPINDEGLTIPQGIIVDPTTITPATPFTFSSPIPLNGVSKIRASSLLVTIYYDAPTAFPPVIGSETLRALPVATGDAPTHVYNPLPTSTNLDPQGYPLTGPFPSPRDPSVAYVTVANAPGGLVLTEFYPGPLFPAVPFEITEINVSYVSTSSNLLSVNDRILYKTDENAPGGRRPVMGASVLTRVEPGGNALGVIVVTYALQPTSALRNNPGDVPFLPPDSDADMTSLNNPDAMLREVEFTLSKDQYNGLHYLTALNPDDEALLFPGQWVIMSSKNGLGAGVLDDKGQDVPQQIARVRNVTPPTGSGTPEVRAYFELGEEPRVGLSSPLTPTSTPTIFAWVLSPSVESRTSDRAIWAIEPREARRFVVPIQN